MRLSVAENWVEAPLKRFVDDARVQLAVLLNPTGQVLGQFGFASSVDVMTACALAAATTASAAELGRQVDGKPFTGLHFAGKVRQIFLGQVPMGSGSLILLTVFDDERLAGTRAAVLCGTLRGSRGGRASGRTLPRRRSQRTSSGN